MWATGIEDTVIAEPIRYSDRVLDEYALTQHDRFWRDDLERAASLGVRGIRYGVPWYRANPAPGEFDWRWSDEAIGRAAELGMSVILDLVHYGTPLWLERSFADPRYPDAVAAWAGAAAARYRGLVAHYTPLNEPNVTAQLCGQRGWWPPYLEGDAGWVRVTEAVVLGMRRSVAAIRAADAEARIIHVEASRYLRAEGPARAALERRIGRQMLATDLLLGLVDRSHPRRSWLLERGMSETSLDELAAEPARVDVMGVNYYPDLSAGELVEQDGQTYDVPVNGWDTGLREVLTRFFERYRVPVMLTETSTNGDDELRLRWLEDSVAAVDEICRGGVPVIGYTWWPLFDLVDWAYAAGDRPIDAAVVRVSGPDGVARVVPAPFVSRGTDLPAYLAPMGAWRLVLDKDGTLRREETPVAARLREVTRTVPGAVA
jgi:beta-glucosidase